MDSLALFLDILKYVLPAVVVFLVGYFTLKKMLDNYYEQKMLEFRQQNRSSMVPIKIQAYERLTIYLDRINPSNMLLRLNQPGIPAAAFKATLIATVNEEFGHNLAQQLYVSPQSWKLIKLVKERVIELINNSYATLDKTATSVDLSKAILEEMIRREEVPTDMAIDFLKKEFKLIFDI
ncbi:MAG: hypothetical protein ACO1PI_15135 [Bacteroidota bacterium]